MNDSNRIVGYCGLPYRAALWNRSRTPIDLGDLGGGSASALAINQRGEIVGWSERPGSGPTYPVLWKPNGEIVDLFENVSGRAFGSIGSALSINNQGEIVGRGWYYSNGMAFYTGDISGGCSCISNVINDSSLIVGYCNPDPDCVPRNRRATVTEVLSNGSFRRHDLSDMLLRQPDITLIDAEDINSAGQIAAYSDDGSETTGYLVTPYQFELSEPAPGIAGERNTITVTNLEPNQRVILVFGTKPGAQPIGNGCLGGLVLIRDASTHQSLEAFADNSGVATFNVLVPKSTADKTVRYQAIGPDECEISHTVEFRF